MSIAILERTFAAKLVAPMTYDTWMQVNHTLDGCLEARNVHWLYSLVSAQGDRSVCLFRVPYTETAREACREACMPFQRVWQADLWVDQEVANFPQGCSLIIAEVNYDPPLTKTIYESSKQQAADCFHELNVQHTFSAVSLDGIHSICVFLAATAEDVRSLYRKIGQPFQQVWKATLIQPT